MELVTSEKKDETPIEPKKVIIEDIPGHFNFRRQLVAALDSARTVITMIDAKDKTKWPEAADILYEVLNNVNALDDGIRVLVACNKQELTGARRAIDIETELQAEIE